jgi:hypothetical protein
MVMAGATVSGPPPKLTVSLRDDFAPLAAVAVTVISLDPACNPIVPVRQLEVPDARPLPPRALSHSTRAIPEACEAVPAIVTAGEVAAYVLAVVGEVIRRSGAIVPLLSVIVTVRELLTYASSIATIVTALSPVWRGREEIDHSRPPCATPAAPRFVDQLTVTAPLPPVTVPARFTELCVVVYGKTPGL